MKQVKGIPDFKNVMFSCLFRWVYFNIIYGFPFGVSGGIHFESAFKMKKVFGYIAKVLINC